MDKKIKNFRDLKIWQKGIEIVQNIYVITKTFPKEELYGLTSQMRRVAVSIPSNISEGFARKHKKKYIQFLHIAISSCSELETHIEVAFRLGYIEHDLYKSLIDDLQYCEKMINKLISCF